MDNNSTVHPIKKALRNRWPPISQAKLARALDLNPSSLTLILSGQRTPPEGFYIAVAEILQCTPEELKPTETAAA